MASTATVGILRVLLSADSAEFQSDLKKAASATQLFSKEVKLAGVDTEKVSAAMAKGFASAEQGTKGLGKAIAGLVGFDVIEKANTYAKAVEAIGGASKLTVAEQAKVNAIVGEATAKYAVLGREAPAALTALANATKPVQAETAKLQDQTSKLSGFMGDLGTQVKATALGFISAQAIIGGLQAGFRSLVGFVTDSVKAYSEQEAAVKKLTTALTAQGTATPRVIADYQAMAAQFQRTTVNSDELINEMQALLVEVGEVMPHQMEGALKAATDLASGLGVDLRTATLLVGKAFAGETGTLKRYGIVIDETKLKTEGAAAVLDAIQAKFGGQAQAEVETYAGKVKQLANAWNEVQEAVGKSIVTDPIVTAILKQMHDEVVGISDSVEGSKQTWTDWWASVVGGQTALAAEIALSSILKLSQDVDASLKKAMAAAQARTPDMFKGGRGPTPPDMTEIIADQIRLGKAQEEAAKAADAHAKAIRSLMDAFAGNTAIKAAADAMEAVAANLKRGVTVQQMSRAEQDKLNTTLAAALQAYQLLGREAPQALIKTYNATLDLTKLNKPMLDLADNFRKFFDARSEAQFKRLQATAHESAVALIELPKVMGKLDDGFTSFANKRFETTFKRLQAGMHDSAQEIIKGGHDSSKALDDLSRAFAELSQLSGGDLGDITVWLAGLISSLNLADKAAHQLKDSFTDIGASLKGAGTDWKSLGTGLMGAASAIAAGAAALASATDPSHKTTEQATAGGAAAGAKIGMAFGPYGALVGAGVGALVGWWRGSHAEWKKVAKDIGKDIGQDISDGLAQSIAEMAKTLDGGTKQQRREWAELFSLDAIIAEAGGLKSSNVQKYEQQAAKLFEVIQRGGKLGAQATEQLNKLIGEFGAQAAKTGGMWDPVFKKLIADSKTLGLNLESVTAAIDAQISKLSGGLAAAIAGAFPKGDTKLDDMGTAKAQEAFDRLSRTALAAFNAIIASGKSAFEAIALLGPSIDQLIAQHDKLGLAGGAAFDQLARFRILTEQNKELVASVGGLNDVLVALNNLGGLNVETLADLEAQGLSAFEQLQAAGFTEAEALKQMAPLLKSIIQAHYDLGIPIDENTQKVIDLARANGVLEEDSLSLIDVLKEGFAALITAVGGTLPDAFKKMAKAGKDAAKDVTDGINKIPRKVDVDVVYHPNDPKPDTTPLPPPDRAPGDDGRRYATGGLVYASGGMAIGESFGRLLRFTPKGTDTVPAMLTPGEGVLNAPAMQMLGREAFEALNAGINPMPRMSAVPDMALPRTGTDNQTVNLNVTVEGEIINSRDRAIEIGTEIFRQLRVNAGLRDVARTPIKGITESGL